MLIDLWLSVVLRDPDMPMPLAGMKMADEVTDLLIDKRHAQPLKRLDSQIKCNT